MQHLLDPRTGILPVAFCVMISSVILYSWIKAARATAIANKRESSEPSDDAA